MVPILLVGLRSGTKWGVVAGMVAGILNLTISPFSVHLVQVLLDHPIAFGVLGPAGVAVGKSELVGDLVQSLALS